MLTAFSVLAFGTSIFVDVSVLFIYSGIPLAFLYFGVLMYNDLLPASLYDTNGTSIIEVILLLIITDAIQYVSHFLIHEVKYIRSSHLVHHKYVNPSACDAFKTGVFDAFFQLLLPTTISAFVVKPLQNSFSIFGVFLALWLQFIHRSEDYNGYVSKVIVTPYYHRIHHKNSRRNLSHVFPIWDILCGTFSDV